MTPSGELVDLGSHKVHFFSGFVISILGSLRGIVITMGMTSLFELIKPQLLQLNILQLQKVKNPSTKTIINNH